MTAGICPDNRAIVLKSLDINRFYFLIFFNDDLAISFIVNHYNESINFTRIYLKFI